MNFLLLLGLGVVGFANCVKTGCQKDLRNSMATKRTREEEMEKWISDTKQIYICHDVETDFMLGRFVPENTKKRFGTEVREACLAECRRRIIAEGLTPNEYIIKISCDIG